MFELWDILVLVFMMLFSGKKKKKKPRCMAFQKQGKKFKRGE